jgi:hypothetical protein
MRSLLLASFAASVALSCNSNSDIPADPGGAPPEPTINNVKPAASFALDAPGASRVRMTLLGLIDPMTLKPIEFRAQDTVWVTEDGVLKGLKVSQGQRDNQLPFDVVFVVDNSGSMGSEADKVADGIVAFANLLADSGGLARFGVVGQSGSVTGALDLSSAEALEAYLKRSGKKGVSRTAGFVGDAGSALSAAAKALSSPSAENGIVGVVFAEHQFSWRAGSQRVFINFTDEATQPGGKSEWTTATLCARWVPESGTIHTVWSGAGSVELDGGTKWTAGKMENPGDLSRCTPGSVIRTVSSNATDLDLTTLPLTDALRNSALVEYVSADPSAAHEVSVTVRNGTSADGRTTFTGITYGQ